MNKPLELDNKDIKELPNHILLLGNVIDVSSRQGRIKNYFVATIECNEIKIFYYFLTKEQHEFFNSKLKNNQIAFELEYSYYNGKRTQKIIRLEHPMEWQYQDILNREGIA